ncbi:hypothetical protein [Streptomyces sp. NPDC012589]|uniref:hypothetical protein n=1 Tax=Streptomyces sp. NPDC012589 TaxID=3364839 RepID=UPI0036804DE5
MARNPLPLGTQGGRGRGLSLYLKDEPSEDSELHVIAFAGSLMDRRWRTAEKTAKVINKSKKRATKNNEADGARRRGVIRDPVVEAFAVLGLIAIAASFFVNS